VSVALVEGEGDRVGVEGEGEGETLGGKEGMC